jgi:hypothetical protein
VSRSDRIATVVKSSHHAKRDRHGRSFHEVASRLAEPFTKTEAFVLRKDLSMEPPEHDPDRCWSGLIEGRQCALDRGHYRSHETANPSPHCDESGREWFGAHPPMETV